MYNVHLTHSLLCFEFVEFTLITMMNILENGKRMMTIMELMFKM